MKTILTITIMVFATFSQTSNKKETTSPNGQGSSDEQVVSQLERELAKACGEGDTKTLERILGDELTAVPNEGFALTKQDYLGYLKRLSGLTIDFPLLNVRVYGNTAVASGLALLKYRSEDGESATYSRFTDTFVKRQNSWQLVATQQQYLPVWKTRYLNDNELKVLTVQDCSQEASSKSLNSEVPTLIRFNNGTSKSIVLYWLNFQGRRDPHEDQISTLKPGQSGQRFTYLTHPFLATDESGKCLGIYLPTREPSLVIIK
ncbi:MAG TPA: DUF4440 domain-containing protein [Pyrinomonadaceae bacterium]|jgi:ketosteroid isomerase-like protein|nr:DUF4440 domain-containing protein [Pyrinomonadaceae bacterium]